MIILNFQTRGSINAGIGASDFPPGTSSTLTFLPSTETGAAQALGQSLARADAGVQNNRSKLTTRQHLFAPLEFFKIFAHG